MKKENKNELIADLAEKFKSASSIYLADFTGLNVKKMEQLRSKFRETKSEFRIVKNTLAKIALNKAGYEGGLEKFFEGPTGIAFGFEDPIGPAKTLSEFLKDKENDKLKIKICLIDRQIYEAKKIDDIAKMPTKKDLLAQLVGLFNSPLQNVVMLMNSPMQNLVGILESLKDQKAA